MNLEECSRCGEEFPLNWGACPFCETGERPQIGHFKEGSDDLDG